MNSMTHEEIVKQTMAFDGGCDEGKVRFLESLGITDPLQYTRPKIVLLAARFQYREGDVREGRTSSAVRALRIPGVQSIVPVVEAGTRRGHPWQAALLHIDSEGYFWEWFCRVRAIGADEMFEVAVHDTALAGRAGRQTIMRLGAEGASV